MECNLTICRGKIDNKVIQVEGENYWEAKLKLLRFSSNEPSSGLRVMLNQQWMFKKTKYKNLGEICISRKSWPSPIPQIFYTTHNLIKLVPSLTYS